jgi:membrane-bound lytic murein transglycosylase B
MGDSNVISAIATLTWDCRRSDFFRPHLIGGLKLVDMGSISSSTIGAKHGEWGHTQFLLGNALRYGVDGNGDGQVDLENLTDALATTANYLAAKGWRPGAGYFSFSLLGTAHLLPSFCVTVIFVYLRFRRP